MVKLKKWPKDWVSHVSRTFKFYFSDKKIQFIRANPYYSIVTDATPENIEGYKYTQDILHIDLEINDIPYQLSITFPENQIVCYIYVTEDNEIDPNISFAGASPHYSAMWNVAGFSCSDKYETAKLAEIIITSDYKTRFDNDDEDDDDDGDKDPVEPLPVAPSNSLPLMSLY
tara:strand:+ start:14677 stop:15192 length:516 start_codon:yes stop_codon:yes gene_type:complete